MKHLKILGLLTLMAVALSAFVGTASSSAWRFTAGKSGANLSGTTSTTHRFGITGTTAECSESSLTGTTEGVENTTQSVKPTYKTCTAFGFGAIVDTTGCSYRLWSWGELDILGCTSKAIVITVNNVFAKCVVNIPTQTGGTVVTFSNGASDYTVSLSIDNLITEVKESTGFCPLTVGTHYHSTFTGKSTMQAEGTAVSWDFS
jgi:hypothetical protein